MIGLSDYNLKKIVKELTEEFGCYIEPGDDSQDKLRFPSYVRVEDVVKSVAKQLTLFSWMSGEEERARNFTVRSGLMISSKDFEK